MTKTIKLNCPVCKYGINVAPDGWDAISCPHCKTDVKRTNWLPRNQLAALEALNTELVEALKQIAKAEGPFSLDRLTHAENTIQNMVDIATAVLAKVQKGA